MDDVSTSTSTNSKAEHDRPTNNSRTLVRRKRWLPRLQRCCPLRTLVIVALIVALNVAVLNMLLVTQTKGSSSIRIVQRAVELKTRSSSVSPDLCAALYRADYNSSEANATYSRAYDHMRNNKHIPVPPTRYLTATCEEITLGLGVPYSYVTSNEGSREFDSAEDFNYQIAYSLNVFKNAYQVERLLRSVYRPQHLYCIHIDPKADPYMTAVMAKLASCFPNVFLPSQRANVVWGTYTVLEADLLCMEALYNRSSTWKYWINLTGQEYPLKTNAELVRILKALNGTNAMEATRKRVPDSVWRLRAFDEMRKIGVVPTKGAVSILVTRQFVDFALHNPLAKRVRHIIKFNVTYPSPSEMFFSTLNFNPQIGTPGAYLGEPETNKVHPYINRLKDWGAPPFNFSCKSGLRVRLICIWGMKDLPLLTDTFRPELFLNKLYQDFEPITLDCLESWFWSRTFSDMQRGSSYDVSYFTTLDIVRNHVPISAARLATSFNEYNT